MSKRTHDESGSSSPPPPVRTRIDNESGDIMNIQDDDVPWQSEHTESEVDGLLNANRF